MNIDTVITLLGIGIILSVTIGVISLHGSLQENENKNEAQKMLNFETTDHSCNELKKLYLKYEHIKYNSFTNADWFNTVRTMWIDNGCIYKEDLHNIEFIYMCSDSHVIDCEKSKLQNPELYKNFNFVKALDNATMKGQQNNDKVSLK